MCRRRTGNPSPDQCQFFSFSGQGIWTVELRLAEFALERHGPGTICHALILAQAGMVPTGRLNKDLPVLQYRKCDIV